MTVSNNDGTFSTVGQFIQLQAERGVNVSLAFGNGIIIAERQFPGNDRWWPYYVFADSDTMYFDEPEVGVKHRLRVAAIAAPITFRISN